MFFITGVKDEDGKVLTEPRNFTTKRPKQGKTDAVYFDKPSYISVEDSYKRPVTQPSINMHISENLRQYDSKGHSAIHDVRWKYAKHAREKIYKAPYEHMCDRVDVKK